MLNVIRQTDNRSIYRLLIKNAALIEQHKMFGIRRDNMVEEYVMRYINCY